VVSDLFGRYAEHPEHLPAEWSHTIATDDGSGRLRGIADFIAGMTDRYALAEHARLFRSTPKLI
jgi:dGTPase